jgi:hypothetical protein
MFFNRRPNVVINLEINMADFTKLEAELDALNAKIDAILANQPAPPVDEQPAVDAASAKVEAMIAKLPG